MSVNLAPGKLFHYIYIVRRRWWAHERCSGWRWRWCSWNVRPRRVWTRSCWDVSTSDSWSATKQASLVHITL